MLMNLNLVLIILMIKNSLSVYGFYERRLNMRGTRIIKTNGRNVRADCSGMVSAILIQAGFFDIEYIYSSSHSYESGGDLYDEMVAAGFVYYDYYQGVNLQQGDILLSSSHIEIFNGYFIVDEKPHISYYSWGMVFPNEPAALRDEFYSHYNGYLGFWRYEG